MKKILSYSFAALLLAGAASCVNETPNHEGGGQIISILAGHGDAAYESNPNQIGTRVYHEGVNSYWSQDCEETIGIFIDVDDESTNHNFVKNRPLTGTCTDGGRTIAFSGALEKNFESGDHMVYAYYPWGDLDNTHQKSTNVRVMVPYVQHPTLTSFCTNAAILYSTPIPLHIDGSQCDGHTTTFNYAVSIANVVFADVSAQIDDEPITSFKIITDNVIAGHVELNLHTGVFGHWYSSLNKYKSKSILAEFDAATGLTLNGTNGIHICLAPTTLALGSKIIVEAETENYIISKTITLQNPITFTAGKVKELNISSSGMTIKPKSTEIATYILDNAAIAASSNASYGAIRTITGVDGSVWDINGAMKQSNYLQMNDGSNQGSIVSPIVAQQITSVVVNFRGNTLAIYDSTGSGTPLASAKGISTAQDVTFIIPSTYTGDRIVIRSLSGVVYLYNIEINAEDNGDIRLSTDPTELTNVPYTETSGTITVSSNTMWHTDASPWIILDIEGGEGNGEINYTIEENTDDEGREGYIHIYHQHYDEHDIMIPVSQLGFVPAISVSPTSISNVSSDGVTTALTITSNVEWTMYTNDDWIKIINWSTTNGDPVSNYNCPITILANEGDEPRIGHIYLKNRYGTTPEEIEITISQLGAGQLPVDFAAGFNTFSRTSTTRETALPSNYDTSNGVIQIGNLTPMNFTGSSLSSGWGGTGWNTNTVANPSRYATFTVSSANVFSLSEIKIALRASGTGAKTTTVQYSINGGTYTTIDTITNTATSATLRLVTLSGVTELQDIATGTTITFRLIPANASAAGGTWYIGDNNFGDNPSLIINGSYFQ